MVANGFGDMHGVAEAGAPGAVGSAGGMGAGGSVIGGGEGHPGGGYNQGELAAAIANAMAAGASNEGGWEPGYAEAQDVANQQNTPAAAETAIGVPGYNVGAAGQESFADWSTQVQPSGDQLSPGEQARVDASSGAGYQDVIGSNTGLAQAQLANAAFYAPPTVFQGEGGGGGYTPQSTGAPGASWNDPGSVMVAAPDMWMSQPQGAAPDMWMGQPQRGSSWQGTEATKIGMPGPLGQGGMISQVDNQGKDTPGAITAGTPPADSTLVDDLGFLVQGTGRAEASTAQQAAGSVPIPKGQDPLTVAQARMGDKAVRQAVKGSAEFNQLNKQMKDKSYANVADRIAAKAKEDPNGKVLDGNNRPTHITNAMLANAFLNADTVRSALRSVHGASRAESMITSLADMYTGGIASGLINSLEQTLINNGLYDKTHPEALLDIVRDALVDREPLGGGIGGPSNAAESGAIDQAVRSFVTQYPWAKGLDPRYIQYLIANPAEVESLLSGAKELNDVRIPV